MSATGAPSEHPETVEESIPESIPGRRALVVEDEGPVRSLVVRCLERVGYHTSALHAAVDIHGKPGLHTGIIERSMPMT